MENTYTRSKNALSDAIYVGGLEQMPVLQVYVCYKLHFIQLELRETNPMTSRWFRSFCI